MPLTATEQTLESIVNGCGSGLQMQLGIFKTNAGTVPQEEKIHHFRADLLQN